MTWLPLRSCLNLHAYQLLACVLVNECCGRTLPSLRLFIWLTSSHLTEDLRDGQGVCHLVSLAYIHPSRHGPHPLLTELLLRQTLPHATFFFILSAVYLALCNPSAMLRGIKKIHCASRTSSCGSHACCLPKIHSLKFFANGA